MQMPLLRPQTCMLTLVYVANDVCNISIEMFSLDSWSQASLMHEIAS